MHLVESPCRKVLFTDIEIEHPTVAKHEFEIFFLNGEKLQQQYPILHVPFHILFGFVRDPFVNVGIAVIESAAYSSHSLNISF